MSFLESKEIFGTILLSWLCIPCPGIIFGMTTAWLLGLILRVGSKDQRGRKAHRDSSPLLIEAIATGLAIAFLVRLFYRAMDAEYLPRGLLAVVGAAGSLAFGTAFTKTGTDRLKDDDPLIAKRKAVSYFSGLAVGAATGFLASLWLIS